MSVDSRHLRWRLGPVALLVARRPAVVAAVLLAGVVSAAGFAVLFGDHPASPGESLAALFGTTDDVLAVIFVRDLRLPRALAAVVVGGSLGASGAIFQSVSGNPLGSPDIIGFTAGAASGALVSIILIGGTPAQVAIGALVGGFVTAVVVYGLSRRRGGGVSGYQLVLVGVGIGAVLSAVNALLLVRSSLTAAQTAAQWLAGSLNAMSWATVSVAGSAACLLAVLAAPLSRLLAVLMLGDDVSAGLGVPPHRVRAVAVAVGVALVSLATAVAGPIAFVALAAPQLARRLTRSAGPGIGGAVMMGALLVLVCDQLAQRLFAPVQLPVGVVTGSLGGLYLVWLLARDARRRPV
ncbi:iron chelate uptake ABC transporter family permease subunit [Solwaraspora sp. WMMD406]|uniref:FecCD family ABC transporter permease n=1 Tax=Solwaraspora sp. WMMD406 TaxID=3016095 RepID=UPI0024171808|nr:iron chelate uptake ABC transporter family permease subunit [Solwaraspora sp. WMMD406]MDG4762591.1 iron chelate uptake ABC transporter family permease subunit [Solwaraspora sp. WMMD406]